MDPDEGKALLGTPNGKGLSWFLINHKSQLGLNFEWDGKERGGVFAGPKHDL
jgi:hypothetical protein